MRKPPRSATIMAVTDVKLLEFNRANFEVLMQGQPQIVLNLLKLFAKRIYDQKRRFMILTLDDVQARVADVFLMLEENGPKPIDLTDNSRTFPNSVEDRGALGRHLGGQGQRSAQNLRQSAPRRDPPGQDHRKEHHGLYAVR